MKLVQVTLSVASVTLITALTSIAHASPSAKPNFKNAEDKKNFLTVSAIEVKEVPTSAVLNQRVLTRFAQFGLLDGSLSHLFAITPSDIQGWITIGEKIWQIIVANKPVVNVSTQRISVLPLAQEDWVQMEEWQGPASKTYEVTLKNLYGMNVVRNVYTLAFNYGGKYNGKGQYIANATIIPSQISVAWGYTLNSRVEVANTVNTGTKESPVPGVDLELQWSVDTVLKHMEQRNSYFVRGDGQVLSVTP